MNSREKDNSFWVETDLEPDDVQALMLLPDFGIIHTIVAGGSTEPKKVAESAIRFMSYLKIPYLPKRYITGFADSHVFFERGKEHSASASEIPVQVEEVISVSGYVEAFSSWVSLCEAENKKPNYVSLKPPHEMYAAYPMIPANVMEKVSAICYMGYNSREVLSSPNGDKTRYKVMLERFMNVRLFQKECIEGDTSVCGSRDPAIFNAIHGGESTQIGHFVAAHNNLMKLWNRHVHRETETSLNNLLVIGIGGLAFRKIEDDYINGRVIHAADVLNILKNPEDYDRFRSLLQLLVSVSDYHSQFLLADQCAIISAFSKVLEDEFMFATSVQFTSTGDFCMNSSPERSGKFYTYSGILGFAFLRVIRKKFEEFVRNKI